MQSSEVRERAFPIAKMLLKGQKASGNVPEMRSKQRFSRAFLRASPGRKIAGKLAFLAPFGRGNSGSMCGAAAVRSGDAAVMRQPCGRHAAVMRQRCGTMRHFLLALSRPLARKCAELVILELDRKM